MGKEATGEARALFDRASAILGYDLYAQCLEGPEARLNQTDVCQPALYVAGLAAAERLKESKPEVLASVQAAAGLSLGEYTALAFAGALSFRDGLRVVERRGEAMQAASDANPSGMVSVLGLELPVIEELCASARQLGVMQVANLLCPGNIVVSGNQTACAEIERLVQDKGGRTVRLAVAGAFHTELMKPADQALASVLAEIPIQPPRVPVWSNVDARPHTDPEEIRGLLVRQVLQPVLWEQSMRNLLSEGIDRFVE